MHTLKTIVICLSLACFGTFGCGKSDDDEKTDDKAASDKAADTSGADKTKAATPDTKAGAGNEAGDDPIVCCEFSGVLGTASKSKCESSGGKVVADLAPPCT